MDISVFFKSVLDADSAPVVLCNLEHSVVYMNPSAIEHYHIDLTGKSIKLCHNAESNEKIDRVIAWFNKATDNNKVHTFYNNKENKDVYMIALRDEEGNLIGYYEKHEYRNVDSADLYVME